MANSTPAPRSLGQVGYEAAAAAVGMDGKVTPYDELTDHAIAQWSAAASAIVVAYDASLFAKAEAEAQAMGLDPLPVPEPVGLAVGPDEDGNTAVPLAAHANGAPAVDAKGRALDDQGNILAVVGSTDYAPDGGNAPKAGKGKRA